MGPPSQFSHLIAERICERLAKGESLTAICEDDGMPSVSTVFKWLRAQPSFVEDYERAREAQAEALVYQAKDIADDGRNDWMERNGKDSVGWQLNGEAVARSRLRVEQHRWMAGKLKPKVYGDKHHVELSGSLDINIAKLSDEELLNELTELVTSGVLKALDPEAMPEAVGGGAHDAPSERDDPFGLD